MSLVSQYHLKLLIGYGPGTMLALEHKVEQVRHVSTSWRSQMKQNASKQNKNIKQRSKMIVKNVMKEYNG